MPAADLFIEAARKSYGASTALDDISLTVRSGELLALLGPSGSGKSSLLMAVAGFADLDSGDIRLNGASIRHLPPFKRNFGIVFQNYALFPHMDVEQNVAYPLVVRRVARRERQAAVARALERVQLTSFSRRYPGQLSGGQQQRVALARALVFEPALLLMDEPLGALDRKLRIEMQREIRSIQQDLRITTLYVTHDQDEAMSLADRIAIVDRGRIAQIASPLEIYDRPASAFVADFIGEANLFRGVVARVSADGRATVSTATGLSLDVRNQQLEPGQETTVLLRPEQVALDPQNRGPMSGVIRQIGYFGSNIRFIVDVRGTSIVATAARHQLAFEPAQGLDVGLTWDRDAARVLGAASSSPPIHHAA